MGRCLIIANQTLGGEALDRAVRDCISRGVSQFYVAVPLTPVEHETGGWTGGFVVGEGGWSPEAAREVQEALEENARRQAAALEEARRRAQIRLDQMIEKIQSAGGEAEGQLGAADPVAATKEVLEGRSYDEVIVSTLPSGLSRWLKMDLPSRVARMTDAPVTTVEAQPDVQP
jgi:GAF domain-containing protein